MNASRIVPPQNWIESPSSTATCQGIMLGLGATDPPIILSPPIKDGISAKMCKNEKRN